MRTGRLLMRVGPGSTQPSTVAERAFGARAIERARARSRLLVSVLRRRSRESDRAHANGESIRSRPNPFTRHAPVPIRSGMRPDLPFRADLRRSRRVRSPVVGHEFATTSISSHCTWAPIVDAARSHNSHASYVNTNRRGYLRCVVDRG